MEPEVHIIEKYFQVVKHCLTMTNVRCLSGKEIDLLAMNPLKKDEKYHVEVSVHTPRSFWFKEKELYEFNQDKFINTFVVQKIQEVFGYESYSKILVVWDVDKPSVIEKAKEYEITIWKIYDLIAPLRFRARDLSGSRDDIMRMLDLMRVFNEEEMRRESKEAKQNENKT